MTQGATLKGCEQSWDCIKRITQTAVLGLDSRQENMDARRPMKSLPLGSVGPMVSVTPTYLCGYSTKSAMPKPMGLAVFQ